MKKIFKWIGISPGILLVIILKPEEMPWKTIGTYSDDELAAIFL